ncbi:hypothetical protein SYK_28040 [Pseudodesulfovibrio nedwellii]|uniref:Type II secretion system protein GspI n=1 Tax=Pseudodesulfovibrio nedwellii TaxID=2973072 RepID=A0ABN6S5N4_9BACT|nr:prepilin-type N-terminal cleavage/methylation domain-containing protein [Pseudodesulfovibrio nedwellii]BDQ38444.1 hypothetical protein SYK_28040 [Pseudodesulfovibrio nedwellii]
MKREAGFTLIEVLITLIVLSVGALAIMKHTSQTQDLMAEIRHLDTISRLAGLKMQDLEKDGFSSSLSREGTFEDHPGYEWSASSHLLKDGGWYRLKLVVRRDDTDRSVKVERIFRELL